MAIQFVCTHCSQPIEVDDEHAGRAAACPYCQRVVTVPRESTFQPGAAAAARPAGGPDSGLPGGLPPIPPAVSPIIAQRTAAARRFGGFALICTVVYLLLFGVAAFQSVSVFASKWMALGRSEPSKEQIEKIQEEWSQELQKNRLVLAASVGSAFFALVGLVLGIVSVVQRGNWRGVLSVVLCGLYVLCCCGGVVINFFGGGMRT